MGDPIDIKLNNNKGYWDISFDSQGDFVLEDGFDNAILISLMCERRANESEVVAPQFRRGWWGNETSDFDNFEIGSKLWLLAQARATQNTLNRAINYTQDALQWMIDDGYVEQITVDAKYRNLTDLILLITFVRSNNKTFTKGYDVWNNTFTEV